MPKAVLVVSIALASLAWLLFVAVHLTYRLNPPAKNMMWLLSIGWPVCYLALVGITLGMTRISGQGPVTRQWPALMQSFFPNEIRRFLDRFYTCFAPAFLVAVPLIMLMGATLMAYANSTRP